MNAKQSPASPAHGSSPQIAISQPLCAIFRRFLKRNGLKFTTERAVILDAVLAKGSVFEVDQLLYEMQQEGHRVSKATVYRTIKHLVDAGIIEEVLLDSRQAHYRLAYGKEHPDPLINVADEQIIEFHSDTLVALRDDICREHGLVPVGHRLIIYGAPADGDEAAGASG
jgi:Fur family ferric uptake transcriptional regulator